MAGRVITLGHYKGTRLTGGDVAIPFLHVGNRGGRTDHRTGRGGGLGLPAGGLTRAAPPPLPKRPPALHTLPMKRFWTHAVAVPRPEGGHAVWSDGRPLRLPGGAPLATASAALAEAIAAERQAAGGEKGGEMTMEAVPLTRLLGTAQDRIAPDPSAMVAGLAQ